MSAAIVDFTAEKHRRGNLRAVPAHSHDGDQHMSEEVDCLKHNDSKLSEADFDGALCGKMHWLLIEFERAWKEIPPYAELRQLALDQLLDEPRFQHLRAHMKAKQRRAAVAIVRTPD